MRSLKRALAVRGVKQTATIDTYKPPVLFQALGGALSKAGLQAEAVQAWLQALNFAQDLDLPRLAFGAALQALTLTTGDVELEGRLRETLRQMSEQDWRESPQSIQAAITLLGTSITPDLAQLAKQRLPAATSAVSL